MKLPKELGNFYVQLAVLGITLVLYLITQSILFGFLVAVEFVLFVGLEFFQGAQEHGWKKEIAETLVALAIAVGAWFLLGFLLNTPSPASAVVSCSMLPNLQRGDMVLIQGSEVKAPEFTLSDAQMEQIATSSPSVYFNNTKAEFKGSVYSYCNFFPGNPYCAEFVSSPEKFREERGALAFSYGKCEVASASSKAKTTEPCVTAISIAGKKLQADFSNDVIVYEPKKGELFSLVGDIIHRTYAKLKSESGKTYYLTKGDNNPVFDMQVYDYQRSMGNSPVEDKSVKGKVLLRIPFLGYLKLFISGFFLAPEQCSIQLDYQHI